MSECITFTCTICLHLLCSTQLALALQHWALGPRPCSSQEFGHLLPPVRSCLDASCNSALQATLCSLPIPVSLAHIPPWSPASFAPTPFPSLSLPACSLHPHCHSQPQAIIQIISNPVNSTVPIASEVRLQAAPGSSSTCSASQSASIPLLSVLLCFATTCSPDLLSCLQRIQHLTNRCSRRLGCTTPRSSWA